MSWNPETTREMNVDVIQNLRRLKDDYNSVVGVIPFVGAGLSVDFGYPTWRSFLMRLAEKRDIASTIAARLDKNEYEEAASDLALGNSDNFDEEISSRFGVDMRNAKPLGSGPSSLIPFLTQGPVITTNFDHILEDAFILRGCSFGDNVLPASEPGLVWDELKKRKYFLLKLHGDADPKKKWNRILTLDEYNEHYTRRTGLRLLLEQIYQARPVVFLGCSLDHDRTVNLLMDVASRSLTFHYAIVEAPDDEREFIEKQRFLRNHKVLPIWYPAGQHHYLYSFVHEIVIERESLSKIYGPSRSVAVIYSHLTMAPELTAYIKEDDSALGKGTAFFENSEKRKSIMRYFLVPGKENGEPRSNKIQQKCRGTKVACICEVRSAAYLAAEFAKTKALSLSIMAEHEVDINDPQTRIYLGIISNPPAWSLLEASKHNLVKLEGLKVDAECDPYFALPSGERLTPARPADQKDEPTTDYGLILRVYSGGPIPRREIVCAGLGEFGTSGAARVLAEEYVRIAHDIPDSETDFFCLIRVPPQADPTKGRDVAAEIIHVPFVKISNAETSTWLSEYKSRLSELT
jgi:hypothetical protein